MEQQLTTAHIKSFYSSQSINLSSESFSHPEELEKDEECSYGEVQHGYLKYSFTDYSTRQIIFHVIRTFPTEEKLAQQLKFLLETQSEQWTDMQNGMKLEMFKPLPNQQSSNGTTYYLFEGPNPIFLQAMSKSSGKNLSNFKQSILLFSKGNTFHKIFVAIPTPRSGSEHVDLALHIANILCQ